MFEACAPKREDALREATDTLQELFTRGTIGRRIAEAQRFLCRKPFEWSRNRVEEVFRAKIRSVHSHEMDHLRAIKRARQLEEARKAHAELTHVIAGMEEALARIDPGFHRDAIAALRNSRGEGNATAGGRDRAGNRTARSVSGR